ncbi:hypothetical protein [Paenibacillus sp. 1001270B_150601_E10]|uniref:hypothetical protein n=1 Tax=Paenibacillus sp. 1001270B_150601_E10 TaxID=2787079 RepID=UPI0018A08BA1|nr:hypothetical protein [Paenibacillus sp. 1001270B_150601_E10]
MSYQPIVKHVDASDDNQSVGLKQLVVTMHDGTQLRLFNNNGKKTINRLLTIPCPICRKDFYCKCFDRFVDVIDEQVPEENWK